MTRRLFKAESVSEPTMGVLVVGVRLGSAAVARGPFVRSGASGFWLRRGKTIVDST